MLGIRAGQLNSRIYILRFQPARDEWGGSADPVPSVILSARAHARSLGVEEKTRAGVETNKSILVFTIRFRDTIEITDQIQFRNKVYDIKSIEDEAQSRIKLVITAELVE